MAFMKLVFLFVAVSAAISPVLTAGLRVAFNEEATCPPSGSGATSDSGIRQVTGAADRRTCLVECSLWPQCVAAYHSSASLTCQLGTLSAWLKLWQAGSCKSHIRPPPISDSLAPKLLAFYNFRFGLSNQLNVSTFTLKPNKANRSRLGLELLGSFDSNVEVDLMGRGLGYYSPSHLLTFFIKVTTSYDFESRCFHRVFNRSVGLTDGATGRWCRDAGRAVFLQRDFSRRIFTSGSAILPQDALVPVTFGTAVASDPTGAGAASFFYNGTLDSVAATFANDIGIVFGDDGLAIGYDSFSPFKGYVHCYGIATAVLTPSELQQLEMLC